LIQQSGSPLTDRKKIINPMIKKLEKTGFGDITLNVFSMPSYPLGTWSFVRCVKRND
jgi:spermidine synthase